MLPSTGHSTVSTLHQMAAWESSLQEERIPQNHTRACPWGSRALIVWNTLLQFSISSYSQAVSLPSARHAPSLTEISLGCFCPGLWEGLVFVLPASRWHHGCRSHWWFWKLEDAGEARGGDDCSVFMGRSSLP